VHENREHYITHCYCNVVLEKEGTSMRFKEIEVFGDILDY
jgi:hypothetical protein